MPRYVLMTTARCHELVDTTNGKVVGEYRSGAYAQAILTLSNALDDVSDVKDTAA